MQTVYLPVQFGVPSYTGLSQFRTQTSEVRKVLPTEKYLSEAAAQQLSKGWAPQKLLLAAGVQLLHWPANLAPNALLNPQNHAMIGAMVFYILSIIVAAYLWANLEIQIEGEHGWAANLPTWKVEKHVLLDWFYGGRPLTGYHFWAFLSVFFFFHLPFFFTHTWSLRQELHAIAAYNLFWIVEDFLWFVLNPHFGWGKFSRGKIWWHKRWFLGLPLDYWLLGAIAALLLLM